MNSNKTQLPPNRNKQLDWRDKLLAILPTLPSSKDKLINSVVKNVRELVNADHTHVRVIDGVEQKLVIEKYADKQHVESRYPEFCSIGVNEAVGGRVFSQKESKIIQDIKKDPDFIKYLNSVKVKKQENPELQNYIDYLETFESAIVVPLLLEKKAIGVLTALRIKKAKDSELPPPFNERDKEALEYFANHVTIALHNTWLLEAATWRPPQEKGKERPLTVEILCREVANQARRRTVADDARVRFVDWEGKRLVPGTLLWPDRREQDLRTCARQIGICPAGVTAKTREPRLYNDLQGEPEFKIFLDYAEACKESYQQQLEALRGWQKSVERNGGSYLNTIIVQNLRDRWSEAELELEKRRDVLTMLANDTNKINDSLKKQIEAVERLEKAWNEYVNYLKRLNSEIAVPILLRERRLGVLNVHSKEKNWFTDSDKSILQALAGRIALAIMEHQQDVLNRIQEIEQVMTAHWEFDTLAELVADGIKQVAFMTGQEGHEEEKIFPLLYTCDVPSQPEELLDEHFSDMFEPRPRKSASTDEKKLLLEVPIRNNGLGWEAIKELAQKPKEPVFIVRENVDDPVSEGSPTAQEYGIMTTACLPLVFGGNVYGLLYIHMRDRHLFTELEREALTLFASQTAIVLKNAPALKRGSEVETEETYNNTYGIDLLEDAINV